MFHAIFFKKLSALTVSCLFFMILSAGAEEKAADQWVEQGVVKVSPKVQADGDSFGMVIKTAKGNDTTRTYRLYGSDCPESDAEDRWLENRIKEQAEHFGRTLEEIPALGKQAAEFTRQLLSEGNPRVWTRGKLGEEVRKAPGRPQRYYAIIEVTAANGQRRWLHELLLEAGLARAHGEPAAWPPKQAARHGEAAARKKFMEELERLEKAAKKNSVGAWKNAR